MELDPALENRILKKMAKKPVTFRLAPEQLRAARDIANRRSLGYQSLLRMWIAEGITREMGSLPGDSLRLSESSTPYGVVSNAPTELPAGVAAVSTCAKLFVSHAWKREVFHDYFLQLLRSTPGYRLEWGGVPEPYPASQTIENLDSILTKQLTDISCFVVLSDIFVTDPRVIRREMDLAAAFGKPILGMVPKSGGAVPRPVREASVELLPWNARQVLSAIEKWSV